MNESSTRMTQRGDVFLEDPVLSARAEAEMAIDTHLTLACDGNARSHKIAAKALSVYRLTHLLAKVRRSPGDLTILGIMVKDLRGLIRSV